MFPTSLPFVLNPILSPFLPQQLFVDKHELAGRRYQNEIYTWIESWTITESVGKYTPVSLPFMPEIAYLSFMPEIAYLPLSSASEALKSPKNLLWSEMRFKEGSGRVSGRDQGGFRET